MAATTRAESRAYFCTWRNCEGLTAPLLARKTITSGSWKTMPIPRSKVKTSPMYSRSVKPGWSNSPVP